MNIRSLFLLCGSLAATAVFADTLDGDGYYRVSNYRTGRYIYIYDNTASIQNGTADLGALQLWKTADRRFYDPGSVIYIENHGGHTYDLRSQHTGVHQLLQACGYNMYLTIGYEGIGYSVSAAQSGAALYLRDPKTDTSVDYAQVSTAASGPSNTDIWTVHKISSSTDEYFGLVPTVNAGGKKYAPFYADFPFSLTSSQMKVYYISQIDKERGVAVFKEFTGDIIPASMPVFVECPSSTADGNKLDLKVSSIQPSQDNVLKGVYFNNRRRTKSPDARTQYDANTMRVLGADAQGNLVYKTVTSDQDPYYSTSIFLDPQTKGNLAANQSYLPVTAGTPATLRVVSEEEYIALSVERIEEDTKATQGVFSLCGVRVADDASQLSSLPEGLYIVNGKKVINRK